MRQLRRSLVLLMIVFQITVIGFGASAGIPERMLKIGDTGSSVQILQQSLKIAGSFNEVKTTDYYGPKTEAAVKHFQQIYGLEVDGITGEKTLDKLMEYKYWPVLHKELYKKDMTDADIIIIQAALHTAGYLKTTDFTDTFDSITQEAVEAFQKDNGLTADGVVGSETIDRMKAMQIIIDDSIPTQSVVNTYTTVSRGVSKRTGEYISWSKVHAMLDVGTTIKIQDFYTGVTFNAMVGHGHNHADIEALTKEDTAKIKALWGGEFSWARRPVLVYYGNHVIAASLNGMPHAGVDSKPAMERVSGRSAGYGTGTNYDLVKGNGMDGHICLHFKGSYLHKANRTDPQHQAAVRIAAGLN